MSRNHKSTVKRYLLGTLDDDQARQFEEEYFVSGSLLLEVQAAETKLIVEYLRGRLTPGDRDLFERRCLQLPDLQRRVDDARTQMPLLQHRRAPLLFRWTFVVAVIVIVSSVGATLVFRQRPVQRAALHAPPALGDRRVITLSLSPGVSMGEGAQQVQAALPANSIVDLILKLPGQDSSVSVPVSISKIGADGEFQQVWAAPQPVASKQAQNGQTLEIQLDSDLFQAGDYAVKVGTADGPIRQTFLFRVSRIY